MSSPLQRLFRTLKRTCVEHELFADGDRVLVASSGGKDSYTMLELLHRLRRQLPFSLDLVAVHLDQRQPGYDGAPLRRWLERSGYPFEILSEDTYSVVTAHVEAGATYCALCSRLRRGILYTAAERLGCNKLALGHHRDDALETMLMNMLYAGKLQAMPARYTTDDQKLQVVRPLIACAEDDIREFAREMAFPILPCNLCGSQDGLKRERMRGLLDTLEQEIPDVRSVMFSALSNVVPTHLLDKDLLDAWQARPAHVRPKAVRERRTAHHGAESVVSSSGSAAGDPDAGKAARRLPLVQ